MTNLDGMRVVLSWGEKPFDLDSHLIFPGGHIYCDSKEGTDANQDVPDIKERQMIQIESRELEDIPVLHAYPVGQKDIGIAVMIGL